MSEMDKKRFVRMSESDQTRLDKEMVIFKTKEDQKAEKIKAVENYCLHRSYQRLVPHGNKWWNEYCCQTQMIRQCILPPPLECYLKCLSNVLTPHTQEFPWLVWHAPSCNCCDCCNLFTPRSGSRATQLLLSALPFVS